MHRRAATGNLGRLGHVVEVEEHAFAGAAAHVGGRNFDLRSVRHSFSLVKAAYW